MKTLDGGGGDTRCGARTRALALAVTATLAGLGSHAREARAQTPSELASRLEMLQQAAAARGAGRHQEALDLAIRAERIRSSPSALRFIADEYRVLGRLAEAYETYVRCAQSPDRDASEAQRQRVTGECQATAGTIRPRLGSLTIRLENPPPPGIVVRVEDRTVSDAQLGAPILVSPGTVSIVASAPSREPYRDTLTVGAGEQHTVNIELAAARALTGGPVVILGAGVEGPEGPGRRGHRPLHRGSSPWRGLSFAAVAVGGAAMVTGAVMLGLREREVGAYNEDFRAGVCNGYDVTTDPPACRARIARGEAFGGAGIGLLAGGGALTVLGAVGIAVTWPAPHRERPRASASEGASGGWLRCGPTLGGAQCAASF